MRDVIARSNIAPLFADARPARTSPVATRPVVFLRQVSPTQWVVRDQRNLRGGIFGDLKSAQKFIRNDFSSTATVVFQPQFHSAPRGS